MLTNRRKGVVGLLGFAASAAHVGYPAWLWLASRGRDATPPPLPEIWSPVSVVVPAYREAGVIVQKIQDLRANGYPSELEIIVVADGDPQTAALAAAAGVRVVSGPDRLGKAQGVNNGVAAASHPFIVLTDANNQLEVGAIAALVRWFEDEHVGAVAGEKREGEEGEGFYWRFESWLKRREAALGTTIGLVGELAAIRAAAWKPIPREVGIDDLWIALDMAERGHSVAYEPSACAHEPDSASLKMQWERRTRNVAGALNVFARRRSQLGPGGGIVSAQIWGHRLWRYTGGPVAHLALLGVALRYVRSSWIARFFLAGHVAGVLTLAPAVREKDLPTPVIVGGQVIFLQAVALGGCWRYFRGDRDVMWRTQER